MDVPVKTCWFGLAKWFWPSIFSQDAEADKKVQQSLTPAVDWLEYDLIGPSGLLVVDGHLLESSRDWWVFCFLQRKVTQIIYSCQGAS